MYSMFLLQIKVKNKIIRKKMKSRIRPKLMAQSVSLVGEIYLEIYIILAHVIRSIFQLKLDTGYIINNLSLKDIRVIY